MTERLGQLRLKDDGTIWRWVKHRNMERPPLGRWEERWLKVEPFGDAYYSGTEGQVERLMLSLNQLAGSYVTVSQLADEAEAEYYGGPTIGGSFLVANFVDDAGSLWLQSDEGLGHEIMPHTTIALDPVGFRDLIARRAANAIRSQ